MARKGMALVAAAAVALAAAVAAAAVPADAAAPEAAAFAGAAAEARRGLTVTGTHVVQVAPDTAQWSFGVQARGASAGPAMRGAAARIRAVVAAVRKAGVARRDIRTEAVSLYPHVEDDTGSVNGYVASSNVAVVVRSLPRAGAVVEAAVNAGATDVYGPSLTRSDADAQYRQALERAYDDARAKAERLAAKVGVSLGVPTSIAEGATASERPYGDAYAAAAEGAVEIEPGRTGISASVTVTFAVS